MKIVRSNLIQPDFKRYQAIGHPSLTLLCHWIRANWPTCGTDFFLVWGQSECEKRGWTAGGLSSSLTVLFLLLAFWTFIQQHWSRGIFERSLLAVADIQIFCGLFHNNMALSVGSRRTVQCGRRVADVEPEKGILIML